jgi:hypothetical protein
VTGCNVSGASASISPGEALMASADSGVLDACGAAGAGLGVDETGT